MAQRGDDAGGFQGRLGSAPVSGAVDEPGGDGGDAAGLGVPDGPPRTGGPAPDVARPAGARPLPGTHVAPHGRDRGHPGPGEGGPGIVGGTRPPTPAPPA